MLHADGARLLDERGAERRLRAANWFGLETETCAPHGLDKVTVDAAVATMATMGFNTIRLPYSTDCLAAKAVTGVDTTLNPTLADATPLEVMDAVVAAAAQHQMSVLLDRHRINSAAQTELWYDADHPESQWIDNWTMLAERYVDDPTVLGGDLHNEPHGAACWGCGDPSRDWAAAATRAGQAILDVNPHWLVVVEGVENQTAGESTWWGGGLADVRQQPITLQPAGQVVYSPHAYPPSIFAQTEFTDAGFPDNLPAYWDRTWGYLQRENIAPVFLGEFGSKLETDVDREWMTTMVSYLNTTRMSFGYWSLNPDSVDTGGLVKADWTTPEQDKLDALGPILVPLVPVAAPTSVPPQPSASTAPVTPSAPVTSAVPTPTDAPTASPTPGGSPSPGFSPSTTAPSPSASTTDIGPPGTLAASWQPQSSWAEGYVVNLVVSSAGGATSGWTLSWPDAYATGISNAWGADCTTANGTITCSSKDWAVYVPNDGSVTVGVQVNSGGSVPDNPPLTIS